MQSKAETVADYLSELDTDRRKIIRSVRSLIRKHLPKGYKEVMNWGMISYEVPLKRFANTYNKKPLQYCALASQKNYCALYLCGIYGNSEALNFLHDGFNAVGIKLNMGKSCIRFKSLDDLDFPTIAQLVQAISVDDYIDSHNRCHGK